MLLSESQLRSIIREAILFEEDEKEAEKVESALDQVFDKAEDIGEDALEDVFAEIEDMAEEAHEDPEAFKEKVQESLYYQGKRPLNEGLGFLAVGIAAAMPVLMKGIGKLVKVIAKGLGKVDDMMGGEYDYDAMGERWEDWWKEKSEDLHHAYIGSIEKIIGGVCWIAGKKIDKSTKHKLAEGIWTVIVAFLMYKSGAGLLKAVGHHSYGVAGLEGALTAIKGGEVGVYVRGLFTAAGVA